MRLLVASREDEASLTIRDALLGLPGWSPSGRGPFAGEPAYEHRASASLLVTIPDLHLYHDDVDAEARSQLRLGADEPRCVVFLSKHRAESGVRSLTVHPIGNLGSADLGGRTATLVPSAPEAMTGALRSIARRARGARYRATFEATHHGPYLSSPAFFLELGSGPGDWGDAAAGRILAEAILDVQGPSAPVGIGFGGGHYVPRLTDVALGKAVAFGHLVPSRAVPSLTEEMIDLVIRATPRASFAYLHRKAIEAEDLRRLESRLLACGLRVQREADLPSAGPAQGFSAAP